MKKKTNDVTLENIGRLIEEKIGDNNKVIFAVLDKRFEQVREEFTQVHADTSSLKAGLANLKDFMNQRFDEVDDKLQNLLQEVSDITDQKLEKFHLKYFPA